ncbi:NAD(P)/FAD-dependent oxidoreductase [Alkalicella caledoniensis]|uniref:NAD(P)/FAD-dependent oxidoreductase n=1 Tax=Alkalicella caledoniensis TaxID=2731377 RepID=A0A7G9WC71_ALKCA|nr:NAD(P)/FAD-dependent oxidoreductase [Alkalicella caledoniensis]QNO16283.1 NAD(P)/FAD-dependent oxidoreductase [Alkalicella caledoniensis]
MYDIAIIGAGPAGLSAAINCKIRNKNVVIFGGAIESTDLLKASHMDNYLGFPDSTGIVLQEKFLQHVAKFSIEIKKEKILAIYDYGDQFQLTTKEGEYISRGLIIATGIPKTKTVEGERELLGKGVGYCATCDGPLYKGKIVAIVADTEEGEEECEFLSELCSKVYYIPKYKQEIEFKSDNIEILYEKVERVIGEKKVEALKLETRTLELDGVFFLKKNVPPSQLITDLRIENKFIGVDRNMATNIAGIFAAGDCTGKPFQVAKAVGEGTVAGLSCVSYIDKLKKSN